MSICVINDVYNSYYYTDIILHLFCIDTYRYLWYNGTMKGNSQTLKRCEAMIKKGIENPDNQEGIDFCVNECPYSCCVLYEEKKSSKTTYTAKERRKKAIILREHDVSIEDISLISGVSYQTVRKYLKNAR